MGDDVRRLAAVAAAVTAAMSYARLAASRLRPGFPRLAAFLPVLAVLAALPLSFYSLHLRAISAFFLAWLAEFKLLLLASGQWPLDPSLPLPTFVAVASLPVKIRQTDHARAAHVGLRPLGLVSSANKAAVLAVIISLYRFKDEMDHYLLLTLYCFHVYLMLELVLASAAAAADAVLGVDLEPQIDKPYLSSSLRDFWGRRWNLMVPAILRPSVYRPVRARVGAAAGVFAAFLVSGLMHEAIFSYITLRPPTGEATAFFALHGACTAAEGWFARRNWPRWRPPRAVATALTLAFVGSTGFWLFFPPITRRGTDQLVIAECEATLAFLQNAGAGLAGAVRSVCTGEKF